MTDLYGLGLVILLLAFGFGLLQLARLLSFEVSTSMLTLILIPMAGFLIFSGRVNEISGAGFGAKLNSTFQQNVPGNIVSTDDIVGGDALSRNLEAEATIGRAQRIIAIKANEWEALSGPTQFKRANYVAASIYQSYLSGSFQGLIVLDKFEKPIGIFERSYFLDLLRLPLDRIVNEVDKTLVNSDEQIMARLRETNFWALITNPSVRANSEGNKFWQRYDISKRDALDLMVSKKIDLLGIVDSNGRYMGALSKQKLVESVLLDISKISKIN